MFNITLNNIITITRGDSADTILYINLGTEIDPLIYDLRDPDKVYLGISEPNKPFECAIIKKTFTKTDYDYENHYLKIHFKSEDTEYLLPGTYYYSIKLVRPLNIPFSTESKVDTLISNRKFIIIE